MKTEILRYKSEGEVHLDFHGLMCSTLYYLREKYGMEAIVTVMRSVAQDVYKTMHEKLKRGDCSELTEFWKYYYHREGGKFIVEKSAGGLKLVVLDCPAMKWLSRNRKQPDRMLCTATKIFNEALAEGTPFSPCFECIEAGGCVQSFLKKEAK